jgi:hypothetical protein
MSLHDFSHDVEAESKAVRRCGAASEGLKEAGQHVGVDRSATVTHFENDVVVLLTIQRTRTGPG